MQCMQRKVRVPSKNNETLRMSLALMLLGAALLSACQTTGSGEIRTAPCLEFKPIYWSAHDTLDTQKQAKEHNAVYVALCGTPNKSVK